MQVWDSKKNQALVRNEINALCVIFLLLLNKHKKENNFCCMTLCLTTPFRHPFFRDVMGVIV
jgi:hypothetical protein